jgi:acyl carrier protein
MTRDEVLAALRDVATEILGVEGDAVTADATFKEDLGADSLDLVEVVMALEERLDISIPEEDLADIKTVGQAADVVLEKLGSRA